MAELDADSDIDAQDVAEVFDEDQTDGADTNDSDALDLRPDTYDVVTRLGDEDLEGVDDARDADEEDDEFLDSLDDEGRSADTPDEDGDDLVDRRDLQPEPLDDDNLPMTTTDKDFADPDDVDGVSALADDEPEEISLADVDSLGGARGERVADIESDNLSDADLKELGYE